MGAPDATKVKFAPKARILIADVTAAATKLPVDVAAPLDVVWKELGYTDTNGIETTFALETTPIEAHQSAVPIGFVINSASCQLKFTCLEFNMDTVELYFGTKWTTAGAISTLDLTSTPALATKAMVVEWGDWVETTDGADPPVITITGGTKNRLVIPRGMVSSRDPMKLERLGAQTLGVTYDALDSSGKLGTLLTNIV